MDRRTPPQHYWAALLRASFDGVPPPDAVVALPAVSPEPVDGSLNVDDLLARAVADVERHAASASTTRAHLAGLRNEAAAALQAAVAAEAMGRAQATPVPGKTPSGTTLDVRR
ncbi:MAG: hypothetical protein C0497_02945 [Gemmatimonas sp.]|nr:hypothetical protein [Gemmatimonas sp.]